MIRVENQERAIRLIEAMNALSTVFPIYDEESRKVFRAAFNLDIADLLPQFFRSLALMMIKNEKEAMLYVNYVEELVKYIQQKRDMIPEPENSDHYFFEKCRRKAEQLTRSWMVKSKQ